MTKWETLFSPTLWNLNALVLFVIILALYIWLLGPFQQYHSEVEDFPFSRKLFFICGLLVLGIAWASPLFIFGHLSFTAHMVQMSLLYFLVPPMILSGCPAWLLKAIGRHMNFGPRFRWAFQPAIAIMMFNGMFILYHVPVVFDYVMTHTSLHMWFFELLMVFSFFMWWPLASPLSEYQLQGKERRTYISANEWMLMPACFVLLISNSALFKVYSNPDDQLQALRVFLGRTSEIPSFPTFFHLSAIQDQRWGSLCMIGFHYLALGWFKK